MSSGSCSWLVFFRACSRRPWSCRFLVRLSTRPVLLVPCVPLVRVFLRCLRRAYLLSVPLLSSYRSAPRSFDKWGGALRFASRSWFALFAVACRLPWRVRGMWRGVVSLVGVARCRRIDGVGGRHDFRRSRCLPWVILSGWRVSLAPVAYFALVVVVGRHGLIAIGCCRRGFVSSSVVVARRRPALLALGALSSVFAPCGHPPLIVSLIVSLIISPLLVLSSRLACRAAGRLGGAGSLPSRADCCLEFRSLVPALSRDGVASRLIRLLACRLGILRERALPLAWRVVACLCG